MNKANVKLIHSFFYTKNKTIEYSNMSYTFSENWFDG